MAFPTDKPFRFNNADYFEFDELGLFQSQLDEGTELFGVSVVYIKVDHEQPDEIFAEYLGEKMSEGTEIYLILDQIDEDFQTEDAMMHSKFGIQFNFGECTFWASKEYFQSYGITPQAGDLIYYKKIEKLFEISKTTEQHKFKVRLDCDLYNYDHIEIDEDMIDEEKIAALEDISDIEDERITTPQEVQIDAEDFSSDRTNKLYD